MPLLGLSWIPVGTPFILLGAILGALGLPPLFDTNSGKPGVGVFALMDYGSNNGRGVIPAFPSPWTSELSPAYIYSTGWNKARRLLGNTNFCDTFFNEIQNFTF